MKASSKFTFTTDKIEPYIPDWRGVKKEDFNDTKRAMFFGLYLYCNKKDLKLR